MPTTELLSAGLARIQRRWPTIERIAPQHGTSSPSDRRRRLRGAAGIDCGVFALADADVDLKRLLHISRGEDPITEALLTIAEPLASSRR